MFQVEITRPSVFVFRPDFLPASAPVLKIYAGGNGALSTTINLVAEKSTRSVSAILDRYTIQIAGDENALVGQTGDIMGRYFLSAHALAQVPVQIESFDAENNRARLADPLPESAVATMTAPGSIVSGTYTTEIASGSLGSAVNRAAYYKVEFDFDPDGTGAGDKGTQIRSISQAGRIRIVRTRFDTGLNHSELLTRVPQFSTVRPPNRQTWQTFIDSVDMISRVESFLPSAYADQTLGEQWRTAHSYYVLAHAARLGMVPNVDPQAVEQMAHEEMSRQAARIHWIDLDDDGEADTAEVAFGNDNVIGVTVSSGASTEADYVSGNRYRPVLNNQDDR